LIRNAENVFANTQIKIDADLQEPKSMLIGVSQNIRSMILEGEAHKLENFFTRLTRLFLDGEIMSGFDGLYGYFYEFGDIDGKGRGLPEGYAAIERPWYIAAVEANGKIAPTEPYISIGSSKVVITYALLIFDGNEKPLGVVGLDINLNRVSGYVVNTHIYEGSYGILVDKEFRVLAHPDSNYLGKYVCDMNDGVAIVEELKRGNEISGRKAIDHLGKPSVLFVRKLNNGWYMAVLTPENKYNENFMKMMRTLTLLGLVLAITLSLILWHAILAKIKTDKLVHIMLDVTPLALSLWNKKNQIVDTNTEALRLFDLPSKTEFIDKFYKLSPEYQPDGRLSREKAVEVVSKTFKEGYLRFEWVHQKLNGEPIPCEVTLIRIKYKDDFMVVGYKRDLREMIAANEKMREVNEYIQSILDTTPLAITIWNPESITLIDCNMEAVRLSGLPDKKAYIEKFAEMSPKYQPDGQKSSEKIIKIFDKAMRDGVCRYNWDQRAIDGEVMPFQVYSVRLKHRGGYIVISYAQDMREVNAANEKIREVEERVRIMFNAMPMCANYRTKTKILECNRGAVDLFGLANKKEYIEKFKELSPEYQPDGRLSREKGEAFLDQVLEDGYVRFEWMHQKLNGEPIPCEVTLIKVKYKNDLAIAAYMRDLREQKTMIREMQKAKIAEESNRAKSKFLATMSHEIRTPMNAILGITEIQLQDESLPPHIKEAFSEIYNSGDLLMGIINDILDLTKIEADKMELNPTKYEVASLINDAVHLNMMRNSKPVEFELEVDENIPFLLFGDELRIKQILNNLLSNAYKYTNEGCIKLFIYAETEKTEGENITLAIRISDTGQGMTEDQIKGLFTTEYSRFNLEANRMIEGTGLGLNIIWRLVNKMNGTISVESELGKGTAFTVRIPQKKVGSEVLGKETVENLQNFRISSSSKLKRANIVREYMPYGKVLVVDDVGSNLYVAKGLMMPYGLTIDVASSGFEAINKIKDGRVYDIVFMDHMMPKLDGINTTKIIRDLGYKYPIVALTANAVIGQSKFFLENGFDEFISKPIDIRQLNAVLNKLIRNKQPPEVIAEAQKQKASINESALRSSISEADSALHAVFLLDIKKALPVIEDTLKNIDNASEEDLYLFTINVHAMKSALANIGESSVSELAFILEKAGKELNKEVIKIQAQTLLDEIRVIKERIEWESRDSYSESAVDEDPAFLHEQLQIIRDACASYDERPINAALEALKKLSWKKETQALIDEIAEQILYGDFEKAGKLAVKQ
jgi:signal transduction histidine kinase/CheY-like chemotaxis protein/HPt (histidine-containing phosphotransfer) domain-containing protein